MLRFLPLVALAAALPALAQDKPATTTGDGSADKPVIITGERLADLQRDLAACIARKCSPLEDIAATLKVVENQFVNGDYKGARQTLTKSEGRNKKYSKDYPVAVAGLFRADSRVSAHLGEGDLYRINTFETVTALKAGLSDDDPRVLAGQIEVGDMYARFGRVDAAVEQYQLVARRANKLNFPVIEGMARLRVVGLYAQLADTNPGTYRVNAREAAKALIADPSKKMKPFGQAARVVLARMDAKGGDTSAVDALITDLRKTPTTIPVLLYSAPLRWNGQLLDRRGDAQNLAGASESTGLMTADDFKGAWVDISFWITPDGNVTDVQVLRSGKPGEPEPGWTKPIIASIGTRRYVPLKLDPNEPGLLRVERYTLTARWTLPTGSHIREREAQPQIEMLDLSIDPPAKSGG